MGRLLGAVVIAAIALAGCASAIAKFYRPLQGQGETRRVEDVKACQREVGYWDPPTEGQPPKSILPCMEARGYRFDNEKARAAIEQANEDGWNAVDSLLNWPR